MNKIFKVIWSKSKQCYIVVSEIAKNKTGKKKIVVASILAALAMASSVQDVSAVTGSGGTNNFSNAGTGVSFKQGEGLAIGTNATVASGNTNTVAIGVASVANGSSSFAASGGSTASGKDGQIAIGWSSTNGTGAVAIGGTTDTAGVRDTRATGSSAVALGVGSAANGSNAFVASGGSATGNNAIAISGGTADGNGSIAIGWQTNAKNDATAVGSNAQATDKDSVAVGKNSNAAGESATAVGSSATASGRGGVAVGWNAESAVNAVGVGFNAKAKANNTVAIGVEANNDKDNAISNNYSSVSVGVATRARAVGSMAMGVSADASGKYSIALGSGDVHSDYTANVKYPKATGEKAIAIGYNSNSSNTAATAIGAGATASGQDSFAGGSGTAGGNSSIAIGKSSGATNDRALAVGVNAKATGKDTVAVGSGAGGTVGLGFASSIDDNKGVVQTIKNINVATTADGDNAVAVGHYANAMNSGVALGQNTLAATGGVAIGKGVFEDTNNVDAGGTVIGQDSTVTGFYSLAVGRYTFASGSTSMAMGYDASAKGNYAVAMGRKVIADGTSTAIGHHAVATNGGLAIGSQDNDASKDKTTASASGAVAIGKNTQSTLKGAVALGSDSTTATNATKQESVTINGITYNFAGATSDTGMQVSVGAAGKERQIKNVAAGEVSATSTDAINGSQLFAIASQIKPIQYFAVNSSVADNKDNTGATGSDSVAIGPKAKAQAVSSIALGNNATAAGGNSIAIGNTSSATDKQSPISIGYGATANGDFSVAIGGGDNNTNYGATANGVGGTALGGQTKTTGGNFQTAVGFGATTTAPNASAFGYNATTSVEGGVALGFNSSSRTGVNKGYNPNDNRTNKYNDLNGNVLTSTTGAIAVGNGSTVTRQITGVAAGTKDTDAVNVAQLKSVNLAFKGNVGSGDVNLATNDSDKKLTIQGDRTYITTNASGNTLTISANKKDINVTNGTARADAGVADAKNVAEAINNAVSQNKYKWYLTADNDTGGSRATIDKEGTVKFSGDSNITVSRNGNTITTSLNKAITVDSVKANKTITVGTNKITLDGNTGAVTGKAFNGDSFTAGNNVLSNTTLQIGSPTGGNNVSITRDGLTAKAGTKTVKFGTNGIDAGDQQITHVSSGGNVGTNAANITDVKNAVSDVTLKLDTNAKTGNVKLSEDPLKVIGANGIRTDLVGTNNGSLVVGLDSNTVNATTKGIGLTGDTGSTGLKYLKDGDVSFKVAGDGNLVTTKASATGVQVAIDTAKVKDLAVEAVTVSKANTADNPITVTPTASTNSKDYAIGIDTIKLASKTDLTYRVNNDADANAQKVSLAKGLNFVNGDNTVATVAADGKVSYDLNAATKTKIDDSATAVTRNISLGADSGTGSSQSLSNGNVSFAVSGVTGDYISTAMDGSAVKVSTKRATINSDANTGAASVTGADGLATAKNVASAINSAVNGLSQNLNISDGTQNSTIALKNQKLIITGTGAAKTTVNGQTITIDVAEGTLTPNTTDGTVTGATGVAKATEVAAAINNTNTVLGDKIATNITNIAHTIALADDNGTSTTAKSLKDGDVSFAVTGDGNLVSTSATAAGVKVAVDAAKVKDLAVAAVTVSKDTQADNPITVTPTAGANSKDYAIGIDTTKLAAKTDLTYRANSVADANAKKVSLSKGLNFVDGGSTVATVDNDGKVSFDLNTATKNQINTNTADITANKGKIATNTTNIATNTAALARNISLGADAGTASSQSLSTADVAFNVKGATGDFVSTNMNGNTVEISTKRATINSNATTGEASVTGNDGLATAQNVADAINKAADAAKAGAAWNITTNSSTTDKTAVKGGDTVDLVNGDNIEITQDGTDKKKITVATKKDITVDSVTANNKVTVGSGANKITLDGTDGSVTGKAFTGTTFTGTSFTGTSFTAGNTVINTNGLTNGTTAITGTGVTTDNVTVGDISIDKTAGINAGNKVISNVASGGTTLTNAANIGDVQNAVANLSQNLNITDGTHDGTVDLKNQKLNVAGANGVTATVNNQTITVGLDADTVNATTKGIGLTADTGSTGNKYLKDGDVSFAVTGDGSLVSTSATAAGVKVAVNSATITAGADGTITGPTTDGVATAKNVADAINAAKKASKTEITANTGEAANATTGNVTLTSTTAADGHTIYDVKLNDKVTLGTGANAVTIDGTTGAITGKTATIGGVTVNGTANTIGGLSNTTWNGTAVSGRAATEDQLKAATGATTLKFTGDVAANTGSVNLKDDTFGIKGDGKYISTDVNGKNVNLTVSEAEVKKSAVAAVTVSTDTTDANNPLTVTPTTSADGTTKDYKVTIDGTKIANKTNLSYKANGGTAKQVSLADGLNFKNGTLTTASIDDAGVVKYDVNTATITAGADGTITGPTTDGVATAKNVADAINAAKKASKTEITANTGEAANATTGNVTLTSTTAADGHTIYDVKLNDKVTLGTGANAVTVDGTTGAITGKTANIGGVTVNGTANTIGGLSNTTWNGTATTGRAATEDQLKAVADAASSQTWNITADKAGTTGAQTGTKKNATVGKDETVELVAGDNLTINQNERKFTYSLNKDLAGLTSVSIGTGTTETIKLDGATGKITAKNAVIGGVTVDGDNNHVTGLANTTWNGTATTGRAATEDQLKAVAETAKTTTDAVNLKFSGNTNTSPGVVNLKDDTLGIVGDGKYVSTDANGKNLTVKVSEAEVKKSAVAAVTVSTDTTDANNPLTVTPTTSADGTTKDYKVTIDGTKIANKTNLSYKVNDGTPKQVSLADGLNFKNGTLTTASIDDAGVVKYDVNTASITAGADGTITGPTTDGVATAKNVADAINAAKKASKTEITANTGEAANATTGNVTLTSTTAADGHTIYDVKLNDKVTLGSGSNAVTIDGTAGKATVGSSVIDGVNNTFTTGGASPVTLNGATGTITGKTANIGGVTVNGTANTIGGLSNTTWNGTATTGRAATEDQLKAVADAAGSQTWEITADKKAGTSGAQTGTKENAKVGKDDKVSLIAGENLTVDQAGKNFTYSLNTDLVKMNSATFLGTGTNTTVITGDSITQTAGTQTNTSTAGGNTVVDGTKSIETTADGQVIKDGAKSNKSTVDNNVIDGGNGNVNTSNATSNTITDGTNTSTITAGKATIGTSVVDGVNNTFTTGGANAVKLDGAAGTIKTGNVTVTGGTTNDITGLSNTTVTATDFATKGRAATEEQLKAATGATTLKFTGDVATNTGSVNLKDDTFGIKGDGKYISTDVNGKNVNLTVSEAEVKKSAVAAVTVSTDTTDANNPLTVTPTTSADGTTKDYKVTIDGTKIANKTNLSYKANNGTAKQVSLADGLNFKNGTLTTASIDDNGVVKYDVNTASITAGADGTITGPTTDGVATAQNVADAINAAKKASKTEITANTGEAANATTGNVTLTSTTAADGHTIYDVKLNDKVTLGTGTNAVTIDGTAGKATIGSSIVDGVNNTFTTGGASPVTLNGATGTITGKTANIGGVTVDGTNNHVMGLANKDWTPGVTQAVSGRAATEDQLQKVSDAVGAGWKVNTGKVTGSTGESNGAASTKVASGEEVQFQAGNNLIVDQNGKTVAYSLSKALKDLESATFNGTGTNKTVITGDSITQTAGTQTNTSTAGGNIVADGANSTAITAAGTTVTTANGNTNYAADGVRINTTGKTPVSLTDAGLDNGNNVIKNVASGHVNNDATDNTNAANIADVKKATTTVTANAGEAANATTGNVTLTSTTAVDGHTIYDVKLNDKVTLGTGANAVTIDGTAGKATVGSSVIDGVNNTFTTGGANAVKLDGAAGTIKTGTVTVTGGTTNDITGLSNTTVNSADFATKGRAATEEQLKAVGEQTWQITADKDATTSGAQTGTKKDAKVGKDDKVQLIAGENMTVNQNERDFTFTLNKDLVKMNSATFEATGGKTTVIKGDSIVQTDGTKVNTSTAGGNTVVDGTKSTATTADGTTVTSANGNTKYAADGVRINTTGKNPVSLTDAGLDNGNNVIKNVASGHVNNDATDNTNAANIADVKKATTTVTANAGEAANATKGNVTLTSTTAADGHTIYDVKLNDKVTLGTGANAVTIDGTAGKATVGSSVIDGVNNTFTTGGASPVTLNGATGTITGKTANIGGVTVDGTNNHVMGLANKDWTPGVTQAVSGRAATEDQLQKVSDAVGAGWKINTGKVTGSTGESNGAASTKVASGEEVQFQAGNNLIVDQNGKTVAYSLNKALKDLESATFNGTGTNKTVITGDSITQTAGTQTNTSTAGGNTVADGTKSTETTAAGQVIKDGTKTNTSTVDENTIVDGAKSNKTTVDSNVIDDGTGNVNTSNATSNTITDGTNTTATTSSSVTIKDNAGNSTVITKDNVTTGVGGNKITLDGTAGKATVGSSVVDGVNNTFTTGGTNAVKLDGAAGTVKTGTVTVTGGTTNDITGLSNTTVNSADFATKGRAATEEQLKAVGEQTWQITADKDATTSGAQTGTKKDAKVGKDDKVQLIAGENLTVNQNERDFTYSLNKDLVKMNSATFEATGGKTTVIKGDSIVQTDGTKVNTSTAGGNTVADGTKSTETTAAGQVIKDGAKSNKSTVDNNVIDDGNGNVNTSNATSNTITDGTNTTATTSSSVTVKDNTGNSTVITKDNITTGVGANKVTLDGTAGKATIGSSVIDGVNNTFTTGGANAVKLDGAAGTIKTGTVTVTGGTTNDITGLSNTTVNSADFATKGRAATEEQLKAVGEQTWQITADKDATTSGAQTGTKKDAKVGKDDKVQLIAGENMTVNQNERDFTFTLNKDLVKMNSATFLGTGTNTTVITGDSITQTAGTQTNTSTAGGNTVADGTKSTETTATGQVIKDGAKSNKSTVDNNVIDDGNGNVNTSNATSNTITDGTNTSTITAGKATIGTSIVDGVNNTFTTGGTNAVKLDGAAGTIKTGTVTVTGGTTNDITGLSNTTVNSADFATKGRAATEEQLKAVGEQTWQITADKDAATSGAQTGTKKDAKVGKDDKVQLIAGENMTVNQNERDFTFTLNKDLVKMNSATFLGTGTNKTVITGDSITQTAGTQTNTSTAAGNIVANGTKSTETTAAGQVIKDGAKTNTSTVDENTIVDGTKSNKSTVDGNTITDGTNTTATTSSSVTVKDNAGNSTVITKDNVTTGVGANKVTLDGTAGKATIGSSVIDGVNNTFTTGGANAVKLDGAAGTIKTGTVTVTGGTTNDITGLSNTTVNSADFATKGRAATEEQLKAVGEQTWQITADKDATTSGVQTGTKKDAKVGKDDKVQLIAGENMTVNQNERDFTFTLNKDLVKMNSATFLGTGNNTTVITGNSITQTAGTQTNTSTAAGNTIANGTKSTETTADGQVIKDGAKSNKSTVDSNVIDDGTGNKNTSNATSNTITDGTNTSTITAGKANIGNIAVDGVNNKITMGNGSTPVTLDGANGHLDGLTNTTWVPGVTKATTGRAATEDQLQQVSDAVGAGWKVNTGTVAGSSGVSNGAASTKVSSGEEVKLQAGDNLVIDQNGKTVSYSLNKDLTKMNSATFEATGGKTTVIKGDSIVQTDGGKTNTSNAAGNTVVDGNKSTATTAAGTTITDGAKTNTSTADKNVIDDGAGNTNVSNATSNTLKNAAGDETKADAKGVTVKDAAGNNATFNKDGVTITKTGKNTVSLTSNGLDNGNNKIVNVAAGVANTDAVNVGQLKEYAAKSTTELTANNGEAAGNTKGNIVLTKTTAADGHTIYDNKLNDKITLGTDPTKAVTVDGTTGTVTGLTNKTWTPGSIVSGRAATEDQLKEAVADSGWKAAVDKEGSGQSTVVGTSPEKIKAEETVTFKAGNNMMVTQTGKSISYAVNPELTDMKSATFKDTAGNTTVTNGNGITITPGSANPTNPHAGPVSLTKDGLNNGNNQIKGVAPGTDPTDAVNVSQLNASNANTSQAINQIAGEVQHVGAHAAAMAALKPIQYDPLEPTQVMAGVGNYRGETAAALGLAHYTNENTMFNVGVSVGGNHNMVNAGVTHKFGYSPEKKNIPDRYKAGPISSVYVMQDEVSSLKKENAEQKYVIADQAARLTTLEAENEQQRRELAETKKGLDDLKAAVDKLLASKG